MRTGWQSARRYKRAPRAVYVGMYKKTDKVTVAEAAWLGVKEQSVGKRMRRGTFVVDKGDDGRSSDRER
jgi:hypothetical protein